MTSNNDDKMALDCNACNNSNLHVKESEKLVKDRTESKYEFILSRIMFRSDYLSCIDKLPIGNIFYGIAFYGSVQIFNILAALFNTFGMQSNYVIYVI